MKAVVNASIASGIANDPKCICILYTDSRYACPELFAGLQEGLNLLAAGTCWKSMKGFPGKDEHVIVPHGAERGDTKRLHYRCFNTVAMRWKDSKVLQFMSTLRMPGIVEESRCQG
eukprot:8546947-Ditylum_brightwellii.AAC.1